jgi:predicted permease
MKGTINRKLALDVGIASALRLLAGPLLAWGITLILDLHGMMAAALIVSSAVPTSLSSVLLAVEFDNEQDFASQTVLVTTALSIVTVTAVIYLLRV